MNTLVVLTPPIPSQKTITLYSTTKQLNSILEWFELYKYFFIQTAEYITKHDTIIKNQELFKQLNTNEISQRVTKCGFPNACIHVAIQDAITAYKQEISMEDIYKYCNENIMIGIRASTFHKSKNAFAYKHLGRMKSDIPIIGMKHRCRMKLNNNNELVLLVDYPDSVVRSTSQHKTIELTPEPYGFYKGISIGESDYILGEDTYNKIKELDNLLCQDNANNNDKEEIQNKIQSLISNMHKYYIVWLCEKYTTIKVSIVILYENLKYEQSRRLLRYLNHKQFVEQLKLHIANESLNIKIISKPAIDIKNPYTVYDWLYNDIRYVLSR